MHKLEQMCSRDHGRDHFMKWKSLWWFRIYCINTSTLIMTRECRKGDRIKSNVSCLDWAIQSVLCNAIQVWVPLEDLQIQNIQTLFVTLEWLTQHFPGVFFLAFLSLVDFLYHPNYHFFSWRRLVIHYPNLPPHPLFSESLKLHLMMPQTERAD